MEPEERYKNIERVFWIYCNLVFLSLVTSPGGDNVCNLRLIIVIIPGMSKNPLLSLAAWTARKLPRPVVQAIYRIRPLARLLRGALNKAAPQGLSEVQVAAGLLGGASLLLDLQIEKDYWLGSYEPDLQDAITKYIRPGMVVYDVGANIGYIGLMLARAVGEGGRVLAFEPLPANVERIRRNAALNPEGNRLQVFELAVSRSAGRTHFRVHASNAMGRMEETGGRSEGYLQTIEVETASLDELVYERGLPAPDVIKMDIEGGEALALPGAARLLKEKHPLVLLELHGPQAAQAAWQVLNAAGYKLSRLGGNGEEIRSAEELDWKAYVVGE